MLLKINLKFYSSTLMTIPKPAPREHRYKNESKSNGYRFNQIPKQVLAMNTKLLLHTTYFFVLGSLWFRIGRKKYKKLKNDYHI